ncbi:MAG: hydroxymethylbilane synthase [Roseburia sp.]|nr:hydroxymethylbilane synthase [Roseburia sp.]MCM1280092.1 hydroxymethylbilane synthase [Robinsoniella sp.]
MEKLIIGTRGSALALAQTELVIRRLKEISPEVECEIRIITTKGDKILNKPLAEFGGKGVFVTEIEEKLKSGEIDLAVHSAKDMPVELAEGLAIIGVLKREDSRDVLVTVDWEDFLQKEHPSIGTSSLRRQVQIQQEFPNALCKSLRGNVNTRLKKLEDGMYDGILLAAAGLRRLGFEKENKFHYHMLDIDRMIPAGGQGIIAIEGRKDSRFLGLLASITHEETKIELELERKALRLLEAGCHEPIGVFTRLERETAEREKTAKIKEETAEQKQEIMSWMVSIWICRERNGQLERKMTKVSLEKAEKALEELIEELGGQEGN